MKYFKFAAQKSFLTERTRKISSLNAVCDQIDSKNIKVLVRILLFKKVAELSVLVIQSS